MSPTSPPHILYLSFTGALQPLGYSQIVRPLCALSHLGLRYSLVSLERPHDLEDASLVAHTQHTLAQAGVSWHPAPYHNASSLRNVLQNFQSITSLVSHIIRHDPPHLLHPRAYLAASVALAIHARYHIPYLFDTRAFWVDELREEGRRFQSTASYTAAKAWEKLLFQHASAAVVLAEDAEDAIRQGEFGPWPTQRPLTTIPTCVDFDAFTQPAPSPTADALREQLSGKLVIGYVGSVNASYNVDASLSLLKHLLAITPHAHLLAITAQQQELQARLLHHHIDPQHVTFARVPHHEMPALLSLLHWAFLLLKSSPSKRASMPTKLAELLAAGVQPVHYGCNQAVGSWIARSGLGLTLPSLQPHHLERAAHTIASSTPPDSQRLAFARHATHAHFSLQAGAQRYAHLIRSLL